MGRSAARSTKRGGRSELIQQRVEACDPEVVHQHAASAEALSLLAGAPNGRVTVDASDYYDDVRALDQSVQGCATASRLSAAVEVELDASLGGALPIEFFRSIDSADDADVHGNLL
jgi:hypothetical protein